MEYILALISGMIIGAILSSFYFNPKLDKKKKSEQESERTYKKLQKSDWLVEVLNLRRKAWLHSYFVYLDDKRGKWYVDEIAFGDVDNVAIEEADTKKEILEKMEEMNLVLTPLIVRKKDGTVDFKNSKNLFKT